ncbi:DNA recombination protein RmuC [Thiomicrospira sp. R3]|uniref:DNA recombination protein RmuC n=1 Tax=Thiomicrospira sp. R3 TaxID=3035472 RepID=UPI00259B85D6|nr:DNA recombination protein RmuC [Thiomicrospira sp. R3]WFE68483.1 DNA recombination protein RmuC [Thiomicrospira sp. R3]
MTVLEWGLIAGIVLLAGLVVGFVKRYQTQQMSLQNLVHQHEQSLQQQVLELNQAWSQQLNELKHQQQATLSEKQTELALAQAEQQRWQAQAESLDQRLNQAQQKLNEREVAQGKLQTLLEEKQQQFEEQHARLKQEFSQLAQDIFEQKNRQFKEQSEQSLTQLLSPFHHDVKAFKTQVEQIQKNESEQRLALKFELQSLQKMNLNLSDQAHQLTQALQGQKKAQGNWGEMILERVLESAGLVAPRDYQREVSIQGEQGLQRPDVVVYLPGEKHLIIDAKTSLGAYSRMVNAESELDREAALKDHLRALRDRMKELSDKDYFKLPGLVTPELVILFVPIESAYVEAIKADPSLLDEAMKLNLLIATPSTLLSSVQIVRQLWRFAEQNKHSAELARRAELFYNKLNSFLASLQGVGNQLDKAKDSFEKAYSQLYSGRANLIKQASEFKDLGVMVKKELPEELVERAQLELVQDVPKSLHDSQG